MNEYKRKKSLAFYIRRIAQGLQYITDQKLNQHITNQQGILLSIINKRVESNQEINRKYLEEVMEISGPSVTSLLDGLEKKGYIYRVSSKEDGRALNILVTAEGKQLVDEILEAFDEIECHLISGMTENEINLFRQLLEQAHSNISQLKTNKKQ